MSSLVNIEQQDQIVHIVMNRPEKRNALNLELSLALEDAFDQVESMSGVRVVMLRGEGKVFSAGIDLMGFDQMADRYGEHWSSNLFPLTAILQKVAQKIESCTYPVIALLHGHCIGMGLEFALACDFRIATVGTVLQLPETRLGLIPDVGGTTRLTRMIGIARAKEYIMTGKPFNLVDAERWGLVNYIVAVDELLDKGHALANELIEAAPLAVNYAKRVINELDDVQRGLQMEAWAQSVLMRSEDFQNGAQAMLTKQKPEWKGK